MKMEKWGRESQLFLSRAQGGPGSLPLFGALTSVSKQVQRLRKFTLGFTRLKTLALRASLFVFVLFISTCDPLILFFTSTRGIGIEPRRRKEKAEESTSSQYVALLLWNC